MTNSHQKFINLVIQIDKHFKLAKKHTTFKLKHDGTQPHIKFYIQKVWHEKMILLHKIFSCIVHTRTKV
jgi:hypothetical protein